MKKLFLFAIVVLGFSAVSFGQLGVTDIASSSATIITPITIAKNVDLNFGNIAVNNQAGTVLLPAVTGTPTRVASGGVTLPAINGTVTAAKFTVTGLAGSTFTISLPASIELTSGTSDKMTYSTSISPTSPSILTGGTSIVYVGGTLVVGASQPAGTYTNASGLVVRVDYN
jgi:hypothetical protein